MIAAILPLAGVLLGVCWGDSDEAVVLVVFMLVLLEVVVEGVKCECKKSTIAPSWFDWNGTTVMLSFEPCSTSDEVSCGSVVLP